MQPNRTFLSALACCLALSARRPTLKPTTDAAIALPGTIIHRAPRMLSLAECVQLALEHNLDIQIQRYNPIIDQYTLDLSYAGYRADFQFSQLHSQPNFIDRYRPAIRTHYH